MAHRAVFLDRDRTIIADPGYIDDPDVVELLPHAADGVRALNEAGYLAIVVSNQSGIARGFFDEAQLAEVHDRLHEMLHEQDAFLDAIYYCPYLPGDEAVVEAYRADSDLRKPNPGMLLQAAEDHDLDLQESWMIGDAARDIEAGHRAGCRTILVHAANDEALIEACQPDFVAKNLAEAAKFILAEGTGVGATTGRRSATPDAETTDGTARRAPDREASRIDDDAQAPTTVMAEMAEAGETEEASQTMTRAPAPGEPTPPRAAASAPIAAPAPRGDATPAIPSANRPGPPDPPVDDAPNKTGDAQHDAVVHLLGDIRDGLLRQERADRQEDFSIARLVATVAQVLAICAIIWALTAIFTDSDTAAARSLLAILLQMITLTALVASLRR